MALDDLDIWLGPLFAGPVRAMRDEAAQREHAYNEIKRRWDALLAWKVTDKAPEVRRLLTEWQTFTPDWTSGKKDPEALRVQAMNLATAEGNAQLHGFSSSDVPALSAEERSARGAPRTPAPVDTAPHPAPPAPPDPLYGAKAALVGGMALGTIAGVVAVKGDGAKAGIAIGGTFLTAVAALTLLTAPAPKGPKEAA